MKAVLCIIFLSYCFATQAQVYSDKVVGKKNESLKDSLKSKPYTYSLPIWGAKAAALGFELPYSAGVSVNYFAQQSDLIIEDLFVGFNNGPMYDLNEIIRFDKAVSTANVITVRPDIWLFPFLNVYGILSKAKTSTEIGASIWVPDNTNTWSEVMSFTSKANFDASAVGFGMTPTIGVGGGWMALDMNCTWTDVSALNKPVFSFVFGPRFGKSFRLKKPDSNIAVWVGAFRVKLSSQTNGSINLSEVIPIDGLQEKVDNGMIKVDEKQVAVDDWWNSLSEREQSKPINSRRYETANRALEKASGMLNSIDGALNDEKSATVQYSLNKRPKDMWNFIVGSQYQLNKHFMVRAEIGFLGSRQQIMTGLQYRFGL